MNTLNEMITDKKYIEEIAYDCLDAEGAAVTNTAVETRAQQMITDARQYIATEIHCGWSRYLSDVLESHRE